MEGCLQEGEVSVLESVRWEDKGACVTDSCLLPPHFCREGQFIELLQVNEGELRHLSDHLLWSTLYKL